jgi:cytochrome c oxidase subunit III
VSTEPIKKHHAVPHFTGTLAMIWFLSGLAMLFGAGMVGYVVVRMQRVNDVSLGSIHLPAGLWASTALVLVASVTIQLAVSAIRRERQDLLRAWLVVTLMVGIAFCLVQVPSLAGLVKEHFALRAQFDAAGGSPAGAKAQPFLGLVFVFILVHAGHVLGGIIQLVVVTRSAFRGRFDHEFYNPVKHAALYWHFLDVIWIMMFGMMKALG